MFKKCLIAMMLATALVVVIPASAATAAPKSDAAVGATPQRPDSTQIKFIGGNLNLWGHEVKAIKALGLSGVVFVLTKCARPLGIPPVILPPAVLNSKGASLVRAVCTLVGTTRAGIIVLGIVLMRALPIGDSQCFQFRPPQLKTPVIVNPTGNCR